MTRPDLDAIQARADASPPGPYGVRVTPRRGTEIVRLGGKGTGERLEDIALVYEGNERYTAEFFAHARTDVPALVQYARELERRVAELEAGR